MKKSRKCHGLFSYYNIYLKNFPTKMSNSRYFTSKSLTHNMHISMKHLLEVVSRIYELYVSSKIDRKRKILKLVFPNFWLDGRNLSYDIKKPFDEFIKGANYLLNWTICIAIRTLRQKKNLPRHKKLCLFCDF